MYCPTCGVQLAQALSYCKHCGANLSMLTVDDKSSTSESTVDTLVWVIVGTTITLLGMALGSLVLIKNGSIDQGLGIAFCILSFVALGLVDGVLLWRLVHLNKHARETGVLDQPKDLSTAELGPASARALNEPPVSVTEQTTRAFEPSYRKSKRE